MVNNSKAAGGYDSISNVLVINNKNTGWGTDFYEAFNKTLKTKDSYLEYSKLLNLNSKDSPAEFVAEVFARRMQGQIFLMI